MICLRGEESNIRTLLEQIRPEGRLEAFPGCCHAATPSGKGRGSPVGMRVSIGQVWRIEILRLAEKECKSAGVTWVKRGDEVLRG